MSIINIRSNSKGFTIIELLVAMVAFSSMILIVGLTTLQLGRMYYKGVSTISTQEASRTVIASVSEQLQFATGNLGSRAPTGTPRVGAWCVGEVRFTYALNRRLDSTSPSEVNKTIRHVLWQDRKTTSACDPVNLNLPTPTANGKDLITEDMRLTKFIIIENGDRAKIDIGIIYGENDLIEFSDAPTNEAPVGCKTGDVTAQWCAKSDLTTNVFRRYPRSI